MSWPQRCLRLYGPGIVRVEEMPLAEASSGEATVAVEMAAICGSDLHKVFGTKEVPYPAPPGYPGHEIVGRVLRCPSGRFAEGDAVLAVPDGSIGTGFADVQNFDEQELLRLPEGLDFSQALMCQQVGTVIHALKRFWPGAPGKAAVIVGGGSAGQAFVMLLKRAGFGCVILAERSDERLAACAESGADLLAKVPDASVRDMTLDATGGRGAELVVDATGTAEGRRTAMSCVAVRGEVGLFGLPGKDPEESFPFHDLFRKQVRIDMIVGTQSEPGLASFKEALSLVHAGKLDVSRMVSHRFPLEQAADAMEYARGPAPGVRKVVLDVR